MKYSVNQVKSAVGEVQKTMNWILNVSKAAPAAGAFDPSLSIRIQTAELPTPEIQHGSYELQGHVIGQVGKVTKKGQIPISVLEGVDAKWTSYILNYLNKYWSGDGSDTQGNQAPSEDLKFDFTMELMDGANNVTQTYVLVGTLLTPDLSGSLGQTPENLTRRLTLNYDDFHVRTPGAAW